MDTLINLGSVIFVMGVALLILHKFGLTNQKE